jgi:hypothetical protein
LLGVCAGELIPFSPQRVTIISIAGLLYLALFGSAVANTAYLWLLDRMPGIPGCYLYLRESSNCVAPWLVGTERTTHRSDRHWSCLGDQFRRYIAVFESSH